MPESIFKSLPFRVSLFLLLGPVAASGQGQSERIIRTSSLAKFCSLDSVASRYNDASNSPSFLTLDPDVFRNAEQPALTDNSNIAIHYESFTVFNDLPSVATLAFCPGPAKKFTLCRTTANGVCIEIIPPTDHHDFLLTSRVSCLLTLPPGSTERYVVRFNENQSSYFHFVRYLVDHRQSESFFAFYLGSLTPELLLYLCMSGMLLMMLIYIGAKYIQIGKPEYAYYAAYIAFLLVYVFLKMEFEAETLLVIGMGDWYPFINNQLQVCAYCMYFPFLSKFLNTRETQSKLHRQLLIIQVVLIVYMTTDTVLFLTHSEAIRPLLWNGLRTGLLFLVIYICVKVYRMNHPYGIYPIIGALALDFFALAAMIFSFYPGYIHGLPQPFVNAVFYYFVGIIIELLFFSLGLGYKNRRDEVDKVEAIEALKLTEERRKFDHLRSVVEVQENERARIAKDLHDGVGGLLSGISISLSNLKDSLTLGEPQRLQYERSVDLLNGSVQELRRVAHDMMPAALVQFGLGAALRDYCQVMNSMKSVEVVFQILGTEARQDVSREVILYRIVQELITNILKHAQAREALVQLSFEQNQIAITVEDDGDGFDYALERAKGSGLSNIKSRVEYLKGVMDIESQPQSGTSVHIQVPLEG